MKLKNVMIVVKDIERSKQFYKKLFGLDVVLEQDWCCRKLKSGKIP